MRSPGEQLAEHGLVDEGVAEHVALLVDQQQVVLPRLAQAGVEDVGRQLGGGGEEAMADPPAADGGGADDLLRRLVEAVEAGEEQLVESGRDLPFTGDGGELLGEERVAVGSLEHGADQRLRRPRPEDAAELLGDVAGAERRQPDVLDALGSLQLGEQAAHRITPRSVGRRGTSPPASRGRARGRRRGG